jgi:hypothetical protein
MAEINQYVFSFKEIVEALIRKQGIHEGIWGIYVEFGLSAINAGPSPDQILPTALIPVQKIGIQRLPNESNIALDAAKVNPAQTPSSHIKLKKKS